MTDEFAEAWIELQEAVERIKEYYHLSRKDIEELFKMFLEDCEE